MWRDKSEILKPDARFANVVRGLSPESGPIFVTIEAMYDDVAHLTFSARVPPEIVQQFDIVKSAYLYSWFDYEMVTLAEEHAYTVLEMAIRRRAKDENSQMNPKATMRAAINHARKMGWLHDEDFGFVDMGHPVAVLDLMIEIRNDLMHGKPHLYPAGSLTAIEDCFAVVEKLFADRTLDFPHPMARD